MKHWKLTPRHLPLVLVLGCQTAPPPPTTAKADGPEPGSLPLATVDFGDGSVEVPYQNVNGIAVLDSQISLGRVSDIERGTVAHVELDPAMSPDPDDRKAMARFTRSPIITRISPRNPKPGDTITIDGFFFGRRRGTNWVSVDAHPLRDLPTIVSWSDRRIVAMLDEDLVGPAEISVVSSRRHSRRRVLNLAMPCSAPANFEKPLDLSKATQSVAFDLVRTTNCRAAIVGSAQVDGEPMGFFVVTDEFGNNVASPDYAPYVSQWRSVAKASDGNFILVGNDKDGNVVLARVDEIGKPLSGWPKVETQGPAVEVLDASVTVAQIAVVGTSGEQGFLYQFDHAGTLQFKNGFGGNWPRRALGVDEVTGGFVVTGVLDRIETSGQKVSDSWTARVSADGNIETDDVLEEHAQLAAAAEHDESGFVAVGAKQLGRTLFFSSPETEVIYSASTSPQIVNLRDVDKLSNAFVAAGEGERDAALVRLDCAGGQTNYATVDLGGEERFEAVTAVYPSLAHGEESGYLAVGASNVEGDENAFVAWRQKFSVPKPTATLEVDGENEIEVSLGDTVTLSYFVENAADYEIRKLSGPGPIPTFSGGSIASGNTVNTSQTLTFNNSLSTQCTVTGCGATVYEIVATNRGHGRCQSGDLDRQTVTVFLALDPEWAQLVQSSSEIMTRYGTFSSAPHYGGAHPNIDDFGRNRCIKALGLPYATEHTILDGVSSGEDGSPIELKDDEPQLILYAANASNEPAALVAYALGARFVHERPTIAGDDWTTSSDWFGHWGGWHTGEGGMTIVTPDSPGYGDWREPWITPPLNCNDRVPGCGAKFPWIRHPALWDVHVFFSPNGALPQVVFGSMDAAGVPEPCSGINPNLAPVGLPGCDTGDPSLEITPFFGIEGSNTPVPWTSMDCPG